MSCIMSSALACLQAQDNRAVANDKAADKTEAHTSSTATTTPTTTTY